MRYRSHLSERVSKLKNLFGTAAQCQPNGCRYPQPRTTMTAQDKAKELYYEFGDNVDRVTEEIIGALYDVGHKAPRYWYEVQEEIRAIQEGEDESGTINR